MNKFKKPGLTVRVEWLDAWGSSGWCSKNAALNEHEPLPVKSVGVVVKHDKVGITLAQGVDKNGVYLGVSFVPNGMIQKVSIL